MRKTRVPFKQEIPTFPLRLHSEHMLLHFCDFLPNLKQDYSDQLELHRLFNGDPAARNLLRNHQRDQ